LSALKERESQSKLQALTAKKEAEMKEVAAKHNKLAVDLERQRGQTNFFQAENEKLKRVTS